jgi:hypothetical protein
MRDDPDFYHLLTNGHVTFMESELHTCIQVWNYFVLHIFQSPSTSHYNINWLFILKAVQKTRSPHLKEIGDKISSSDFDSNLLFH